jgi:hypothetical protein
MDRLASMSAPIVIEDDGQPILRPRIIDVAFVLIAIGAILLLLVGGGAIATSGSQLDNVASEYKQVIGQCQTSLGGYGTTIPTTASPVPAPTSGDLVTNTSSLVQFCHSATSATLTDADRASFRSSILISAAVSLIFGIAAAVGGWFFRGGIRWARRLLIGVVVLSLLGTFLGIGSSLFSLLATLLLVVGLVLSFVGKGSVFFLRVQLRRSRERM